ncbi:MAG: tetratricopeptide repeat protein [Desulfurivibrio sp.]|nr:tetratricopeptide repeat protein [Desulfurivibrio sp.]
MKPTIEAAIAIFEDLLEEPDEQLVFDALVGMARAQATNGEHRRAVDSFQELLRRFPLARFSHPAALLDLGRSYFVMGREEEGRDQVFAFLNLAPDSPRRWEALFAAAESWLPPRPPPDPPPTSIEAHPGRSPGEAAGGGAGRARLAGRGPAGPAAARERDPA